MREHLGVLRRLARLGGYHLDPDEFGIAAAHNPDNVCAFIAAGCAVAAADAQEALLVEAATVLANVFGGTDQVDEIIQYGERLHAVSAALARAGGERDHARNRFARACGSLLDVGALSQTATPNEAGGDR